MIGAIFGWILKIVTGGALQRVLDMIDKKTDAGVRRDELRASVVETYAKAQTKVLTSKAYLFPLLFAIPVGIHFGSVCIYSVFWCSKCAFPMAWTIAALPPPFDSWEGAIVLSFFIGAIGTGIMNKIR